MCSRAWVNICGSIFLFFCLDTYITTVTLIHGWVTTDNHTWGLWRWCDRNRTNQEDDDHTGCQVISPGDSPGYFEGVRAMALVTLIMNFIFMIVLWVSSSSSRPRAITSFLYFASAATTLAVLGVKYKTDDRWKDSNPLLGLGYWVACGCAGFNVFLFLVMTASADDSKTQPPGRSCGEKRCRLWCCVSDPLLPTVTRRASNASSLFIDTGKKVTIFHSHPSGTLSPSGFQANPACPSNNLRELANQPSDLAYNSRDFSSNPRDPSNIPRGFPNSPRDLSSSKRDLSNRENPDGREITSLANLQFPVLSLPRVSLPSEHSAERTRAN